MSGLQNLKFEKLREDDQSAVSAWLLEHLQRHMKWWSRELGPGWADERIREHIGEHRLVE